MKQKRMSATGSLFAATFKNDMLWALLCMAIVLVAVLGGLWPELTGGENYLLTNEFTDDVNVMFSTAFSAFGVFLAVKNFSFMYSSKKADTFYALPISRRALFWVRYLSGTVACVFPAVLYYGLRIIDTLINEKQAVGDILIGFFRTITEMFALSVFVIFCAVLAGNLKNLFLSAVGLIMATGLIGLTVNGISESFLQGVVRDRHLGILSGVTFSPVGAVCNIILKPFVPIMPSDALTVQYLTVAVKLLVCGGVAFAASHLFSKRGPEAYGKSFAFQRVYAFFIFVVALGAFGLNILLTESPLNFWLVGSVCSMLAALLFGIISKKNLKEFKTAIFSGAAAVVTLSTAILLCITGLFGWTGYTPKAEKIERATLQYGQRVIAVSDAAEIMELHKKIAEELPVIKDHKRRAEILANSTAEFPRGTPYAEVTITYTLKNGKEVARRFYVVKKDYEDELYKCHISNGHIEEMKNMASERYYSVRIGNSFRDDEVLSNNKLKQLLTAYLKDIETLEKSDLWNGEWQQITIRRSRSALRESYSFYVGPNTEKVLEEMGY